MPTTALAAKPSIDVKAVSAAARQSSGPSRATVVKTAEGGGSR
jgi:hypothetical protein